MGKNSKTNKNINKNEQVASKPKAKAAANQNKNIVSENVETADEKKLLSNAKKSLTGLFKKKDIPEDKVSDIAADSANSQKAMSDSSKTMIVPKADTGKIILDGDENTEKPTLIERIFPEKYFTYDEKPKNFGLSIAVTSVRMFVIFVFVGLIAGMGALFGVASAYVETSPAVNAAVLTDLSKTSLIFDASGKEIAKYTGVENRVWVKLEEMPENLKNAFVSIEDTRFYSHEGIDYKRLFGAFVGNLQSSSVQGGSTISQQLVKIRMLTSERSYKRKIQEAYMTMNLEKNYSKNQILESYMNTILLGGSNYGVEAAANDYFDKSVKDLTLRECAMLAGITQSPNKFNPRSNYYVKNTPETVDERTNLVLQSMYSGGRISHDQLVAALEEKADIKKTSSFKSDKLQYAYFVEYAVEDIINNLITQRGLENTKAERNKIENELRTNGYRIHLTIDSNIQNTVQTTLSEWNRYPRTRKTSDAYKTETIGNDTVKTIQPEAAAVVYDYKNGEYKAIVGGRNLPTAEKILNRASNNSNGVGSSIKPITVYGPALDMGMSPNSMVSNETTSIPGWVGGKGYPAGGGANGMVTLRSALVKSMNRATARLLLTKVGPNTAADYLLKMGVDESHIPEKQRTGSGLALGTAPITPIEMATCFGTIANSGVYMKPITFSKVENNNGEVILDGKAIQENSKTQVYKESTAYILTDMLEEAVSGGTGTAAKISGMATAGKTGTNENKNVSFSGYTPYYSATLYIGHDEFKDLANVFAGTYAAPLWKSFMTKIHQGLPNKKIIDGTGIDLGVTNVSICSVSGLRATDACSHDIQGNTPGNNTVSKEEAPKETCNVHQLATICSESHKSANEACPNKIDVSMLKAGGKVSANGAATYLAALKSKYANLDTGTKCTIHKATTTSATTTTTGASTTTTNKTTGSSSTTQNTSAARTEAANTLGSAKKIIDNKNNGYSSDKLAKLKNAYNNLSSYYKRSDATEAGIRQRIANLKKYM